MDKELLNGIILLVIGFFLGILSQVVISKIIDPIHDPLTEEMKSRQIWPWQYTIGEPSYLFPREINDGERNEIFIHFQIPQEYYTNDLVLFLNSSEIQGDNFSVNVSVKHANGKFASLGIVQFNKQLEGLKKNITVPMNNIGPGANTLQLRNQINNYQGRWLFWDYLSLRTKTGDIIWEIGKEDNSKNEFHPLNFKYP